MGRPESSTAHRRTRLLGTAVTVVAAGALTASTAPAQAVDAASGRRALPTTVPRWATPQADVGGAAATAPVNLRVHLAGRDPQGLRDYAAAVTDPGRPTYGQYLTPDQARERFGPASAQVTAVRTWLAAAGLQVTSGADHYLTVTGTVAAAERAFHTSLHNYRVGATVQRAPRQPATVPADLVGTVLAVSGLDTVGHRMRRAEPLPPPGPVYRNAPPCSAYFGQRTATTVPPMFGQAVPYAPCGYTPRQLRGAYGVTGSGLTGRGVTVAITDAYASPTILADVNTYARRHGDAPMRPGQFTQLRPSDYRLTGPTDCDAPGWYGEETLDVEAVHAMAPDANVVYVAGASCQDEDLLDALARIVDTHAADIVSNSWGDLESNLTPDVKAAYQQIFQQGAVEGIGFYFSSGDNGDERAHSGTKQTDYPTSDPWVTSVGGTHLAIGRHNDYRFEAGWGTAKYLLAPDGTGWVADPAGEFLYGAGGGTSHQFDQPFYQRQVVPDVLSKADGSVARRVVPDIGAVGDPNTGMSVGQSQTFPDGSVRYSEYRIGGTSLACPLVAGVQALAQQAQHGVPLGFANPAIYQRSGTSAFHDVTDFPLGRNVRLGVARVDYVNGFDASGGLTTTLRAFGYDSSLHATPGYDDVTGVGTPTRNYLTSFRHR